jgi:hypothetical protein
MATINTKLTGVNGYFALEGVGESVWDGER